MKHANESAPGYGWTENAEGDVLVPDDGEYTRESTWLAEEYNSGHEIPVATEFMPPDIAVEKWRPADKSQLLRQEFGFDPHTTTERNEAIDLIMQRHPGKHLNEVLLHQKKLDLADPRAALRSLVRSYGAYAKESSAEAGFAELALSELREANPVANFAKQYDPEQGACVERAHAALRRQVMADIFLEEGVDEKDYLLKKNREACEAQVREVVEKMRVHEARERLARVVTSEKHRQEFWINQLEGAKRHGAVRSMAQAVIENTTKLQAS